MPFLRRTTPIWSTPELPGRLKEWKSCLVEIGQTAHKLETNANANFSHSRELGISMYGECREKHAHDDFFVTHCGFQVQYSDN